MLTVDDLEAYDAEIRDRVWKHDGPAEIFEALVVEHARETAAACGFAAVSVPAALAHDTKHTVEVVSRLEKEIALPNVALEIPATDAGVDALELCIAEGMNAAATLIFSGARLRAVLEAYLRGLELRLEQGGELRGISAYAKFFVAPIDGLEAPLGPARACAKLAGDLHAAMFTSERWQRLHDAGAQLLPLMIVSVTGEEIEPMELIEAQQVLIELHANGVNLDERLEAMLEAALDSRMAGDVALYEAIEAKRRALPTTAPEVRDQREIADLGQKRWAREGGYDLP